jgi:hypothetical protein
MWTECSKARQCRQRSTTSRICPVAHRRRRFDNQIFLRELQQARPTLDAQNAVGTAASGIARNEFSSPTHAATSDAQIVDLGMPKYPRYGPLTGKTMVLEDQSAQFDQDFSAAIAVGDFNQMYDDQLGSGSNGNTRAQVGVQAEIDSQRYSMSVS